MRVDRQTYRDRQTDRQTDTQTDTQIAIRSTPYSTGGEVKLDAADKSSELKRNWIYSDRPNVINSLVCSVYFRRCHASLKSAVNFRRSQLLTIDRHGNCIRPWSDETCRFV